MVNRDRMLGHLLELVQIDSETHQERDVAANLHAAMTSLGAECSYDDAGEKVGGNVGNLFARVAGTDPNLPPLFLSAHMDTVVPGKGVRPKVDGDRVITDGTTVLGGDDKSGCAAIVEIVRPLKERGLPYGDLEIVFTIGEEKGLLGAKLFDTSRLRAKYGIVLDSDDPGLICTRAPAADRMEWTIHGRESHAGVEPENGISAIRIAARAIASANFGRIDAQTTSNIGVIEGGDATNIIAKRVRILGEARSLDMAKLEEQTRHLSQCFHDAVDQEPPLELGGTTYRAKLDEEIERDYEAMDVHDDSQIVVVMMRAAKAAGVELHTGEMGGGCDANAFNQRGLECVNFGTGMQEIHTVNEWLDLPEFYRSAEIALHAVLENR